MTQTLPNALPHALDDSSSTSFKVANEFNGTGSGKTQTCLRTAAQEIIENSHRNIDEILRHTMLSLDALQARKIAQIAAITNKFQIK